MSVIIRSLVNYIQTLDSVDIGPFKTQTRDKSTTALAAAVAAKTLQLDSVTDASDPSSPGSPAPTVYRYAPVTGATQLIPSDAESVVIEPAGTIAAYTLTMPAAPYDGQAVELSTVTVITALTMAASGTDTLKAGLTAATANGFAKWRYKTSTTTWYRVG